MGGIFGKDAPKPPNPTKVAAAQTGTNVSTAVANNILGNPTQVNPWGVVRTEQIGAHGWTDPSTGKRYNIPKFRQTTTLNPNLDAAADDNMKMQRQLAATGLEQSQRARNLLKTNMNFSGAPMANRRAFVHGYTRDPENEIAKSYGTGAGSAVARQQVQDALMRRMSPALDQDRAALEQRLADRGIASGTEAYDTQMDAHGRRVNDARMAAIINAGQEHSRLDDIDYRKAAFGNQAVQQGLGIQQAAAEAGVADRADFINERQLLRNQPLNEIAALASGSQVQAPQFTPMNMSKIPTVDYAGLVNNNYNQRAAAYQAQANRQADLVSGIMGMGSAAITGGLI